MADNIFFRKKENRQRQRGGREKKKEIEGEREGERERYKFMHTHIYTYRYKYLFAYKNFKVKTNDQRLNCLLECSSSLPRACKSKHIYLKCRM